MIAKSVYDALGAKTYVINNEPDGTNINRDCGSTHIEVLQGFVKEKKAGYCICLRRGCRPLYCCWTRKGNVVDGDLILYICGNI